MYTVHTFSPQTATNMHYEKDSVRQQRASLMGLATIPRAVAGTRIYSNPRATGSLIPKCQISFTNMRFYLFLLILVSLTLQAEPDLYVTTTSTGVHVVDTATRRVETTLTGFGASNTEGSGALSPDGTRAYLVMSNINSVQVYATATNQVLATWATGASPKYAAVTPNGAYLYVARAQGQIDRIDTASGNVTQNAYQPTGGVTPSDIAINRAGSKLYVAETQGTGQIRVLNIGANGALSLAATIPLQGKPRSLAVSVDDQRLFAAGDGIAVLDLTSNTQITRVGGGPFHTIRVADAYRAYVTSTEANIEAGTSGLNFFELLGYSVTPVEQFPGLRGLALSPDGTRAWVASAGDPEILEVNLVFDFTDGSQIIPLPGTATPIFLLLGPSPRPASGCVADVQPGSVELPSGASTRTIGVTQPNDCSWTATSNASWLRVTAGAAGTGNGVVTFTADANTGLASRTGALNIGGRRVIVTQAGQLCTYTISPGSRLTPSSGGFGDIDVSAPTGCPWTAVSDAPWIRVLAGNSGSGTAVGGLYYSVDANTSAANRVGTITVAGRKFAITQLGTGPAIECYAFGNPAFIRADGLTERGGDIEIHCSSTGSTTTSVSGDIFVQTNAPITNRKTSTDATDAYLLAGEPSPASLQPGVNAFRGFIAGPNRLRFSGQFSIGPNGLVMRIVNIRVNASLIPAKFNFGGGFDFGAIYARVTVRSTTPVAMAFDNTVPGIAFGRVKASIGNVAAAGPNAVTLPIFFGEQHETHFKPRISNCNSPASTPGVECNTESGFMNTAKLGETVGAADTATRLRLRIPVPPSVKVYAPINNVGGTQAALVNTDASGAGNAIYHQGTSMFGGSYKELPSSNGIVTAVWDVVQADAESTENFRFNLVLENATEAQRTEIIKGIIGSYAPVSTVMGAHPAATIPRFTDPLGQPKFVNLRVVTRAVRIGPLSDLSKGISRLAVGSSYAFNYDVYNDSSETATNVVIRGSAPAQFTYSECSVPGGTCTVSGPDVVATVPQIGGGESASVSIKALQTINLPPGSLLESRVNVTSDEADADLPSNEASPIVRLEECPANILSPASATFSAAGGTGQFNIGACSDWTVWSSDDWVSITSARAGTGAATVSYTVKANPVPGQRSTTIIAAGQQFTITQAPGAGACTYSVSPQILTFAAAGETHSLHVQTRDGCAWSPAVTAPFGIQTAVQGGGASSGSRTLNVTVGANSGVARSGTIDIGGQKVTINQSAACPVTLNPAAVAAPAEGTASTIFVTSGCAWQVSTTATWMRTLKFPTAIALSIDPNFAPRPRTGTVQIGSQALTVTQAAATGSEGERLARLLFFQLFGRAASASDVQNWAISVLVDRPGTVLTLFNAGETDLRSKFIVRLYRGLLKRAPEYGGWLFQRNAMAAGDVAGPEQVRDALISNFLSSQEFRLNFGEPDNAEFVRIIYRQMLGREPSQPEVNFQVGAMGCPTARCVNGQIVMARNTILTPEATRRLDGGLIALLVYHALLLREAHPAEIAAVEAALAGGKPLSQLIAEIVATAEFQALYK